MYFHILANKLWRIEKMKKYLMFMFCLVLAVCLVSCGSSKKKDSRNNAGREGQFAPKNDSDTSKQNETDQESPQNQSNSTVSDTTPKEVKKPYLFIMAIESVDTSSGLIKLSVQVPEESKMLHTSRKNVNIATSLDDSVDYTLLNSFPNEDQSRLLARVSTKGVNNINIPCVQFNLEFDGEPHPFCGVAGDTFILSFDYEQHTWSIKYGSRLG
jgi:hypothetical protein